MTKFYVSYGGNTYQSNQFSVIEAEDYSAARQVLNEKINNKFAFVYTEAEFAGQQERYGLIEIPLQEQVKLPVWP